MLLSQCMYEFNKVVFTSEKYMGNRVRGRKSKAWEKSNTRMQ